MTAVTNDTAITALETAVDDGNTALNTINSAINGANTSLATLTTPTTGTIAVNAAAIALDAADLAAIQMDFDMQTILNDYMYVNMSSIENTNLTAGMNNAITLATDAEDS